MQTTPKKLFISVLALLLFVCSSAWSFPADYDRKFKTAASRYLPGVSWKLLKAQCYQESLLKSDAVSPVGAQGLCQFMPGTWRDVSTRLEFNAAATAFDPKLSIEAAAYYMATLRRQWSAPRPDEDRHSLAMASYNAGLGHLLRAQKRCGNAALYPDVITCLPAITGRHSVETITYVRHIWGYWARMMAGD